MKRLFLATVLFTLAILSGGKAMAQFEGGNGTQNDPYLIATAEQFNKMGGDQDSNTTQGKYYKQIANLTFGGQDAFDSIDFSGHYDGGGHWITADRTQNTALFRTLSGSVKNVTLFGIDVQTDKSSGILAVSIVGGRLDTISVFASSLSVSANASVLFAGILASFSHTSTVFCCGVDNCSISFNPGTGAGEVGGLVGVSHGDTLEYSSFSGKIDLYGSNSNRYASGLIGRADGSSVKACMVSDGYVNVAENTDTGNINANICGLVYSAGNPHTAIRNSAVETNFGLNFMGNSHLNNPNVYGISNSTDTSKCATIFSDVNPENITQTAVYLNDGLTPPAFRVSNGQIVHATTPEMNFTNGRYESIVSGRFDRANTWVKTGDATPPEYIINQYHKVSIEQGVTLPANINIRVKYAGSLINKTDNAVTASMEGLLYHGWYLIGFPVQGKSAIAPLAADNAPDIWALAFDYPNNKWNEDNFLHYNDDQKDSIEAGNGIMAYCDFNYTPITTGLTVNDNLIVTNPVTGTDNDGRWMALANPYPATITTADIKAQTQGQTIYVYTLGTWHNIDILHSGTGFMVNMPEGHSIVFRKNMIDGYGTTTGTKSTPAKRDFLTVSVSTDGYKVPVMFAKNEAAREDYDIFDANKLFGDGSVAEPYLLCNGINLCKEEVNSLPYTATMNIKSGEARSVEIIADNIPEGYSLVLLDGEEEIAMNQGDIYTVNIASGENADRFKLKIGEKNVSITDIEVAEELSIRNNNRNIIIEGGKNIRAEVYNTLGQKVYETTARNFNIEGVAAGAYVIKVQSGNAVQSHKMIIR